MSTAKFQRYPRRIDLGSGLYWTDNNIKAADYAVFAAGFNGEVFTGKEYSNRYWIHRNGQHLRSKLDSGEMITREDGLIINRGMTWSDQGATPERIAASIEEVRANQ